MAVAGGVSAQFGMVDETTFGTPVTVSRFLEFTDESLNNTIDRIETKGLRPTRRVLPSGGWVAGRQAVAGDVDFEVSGKGFGLLLKHMMGTIATSQPNVGSFPTVFEHKATVGPLDGKSFTAQVGRTDSGLTTRAFTYAGCKVAKWELDMDNQGILTLKASLDGASESTAVGLASASYASAVVPMVYTGGAISIGGTPTPLQKFSLSGDNAQRTDRYFISATTPAQKREQLEGSGIRQYGGSIDMEFMDLTTYNLFVNGTVGALTAFFQGPNIAGSFNQALEVTIAAVRFDGDTPNVGGADLIDFSLPYKVLDSAVTDGPVSIVYRTTDTTP